MTSFPKDQSLSNFHLAHEKKSNVSSPPLPGNSVIVIQSCDFAKNYCFELLGEICKLYKNIITWNW